MMMMTMLTGSGMAGSQTCDLKVLSPAP